MKTNFVRFLKCAVCVLLLTGLCGCWNSRELDTLGIVLGVGIDKPEGSGKVQITAQIVKPGNILTSGKNGGTSVVEEAYWNVEDTEDTIFGTIRDLTNKSSRKLFFSHMQVLIIGKSAAEDGIRDEIDFFLRDPEPRLKAWVLVAEDSAGAVLDVKSGLEKIPAQDIGNLVENESAYASQTYAVSLRAFATALVSESMAPVAPMIEVTGEGDQKIATITGTAVFRGDKLVGRLDKAEGRGLLWVLGEVKSGIIEVESPENNTVSLEIIRASGKVVPELQDGRIIMHVTVNEEGNIGEQTGNEDLTQLSAVSFLEDKKEEEIRTEVMAAVEKAKELDADIFGFGESIHEHYPDQWKEMKDEWDKLFREVEVQVHVEAKVRLTGMIGTPIEVG